MRRPGFTLVLVYGCTCIPSAWAQSARQDRHPILDAGDKAGIAIAALTFAALVVAAVWGYLKWRNYRAVQHPHKASFAGVAQLPSTHQDTHKHWQRRDASGKAAAGMPQLVRVQAHRGNQAATAAAAATTSHSSLSFVGRAVCLPAAPCAAAAATAAAAAATNNRDTVPLASSLSGSIADDAHYPSPVAGSAALCTQHSMVAASSTAGSDYVAPLQQQHSVRRQTTARSPTAAGSGSARHALHPKPSLLKQQSTAMFVGFTRDECMIALTNLDVSVSKLVHGSIRSNGELGVAKPWLLKGLDSARLLIDEHHRHGHQLDVHWGKSQVMQWLHSNMWTQEDHHLIADMLTSATAAATTEAYAAGTDVTDADIARQLLIEVRKNPMQEACTAAVAGFTNQMMGQMTAAGQTSFAQLDTSASRRAAMAVVEAALLFMLQVMGTSEGMQIFVPALRGDATGSPPDAVEFDDMGVITGSPCYVLCTKPGVLAIEAGSHRIVAIQPAQATRYAHSNTAAAPGAHQ